MLKCVRANLVGGSIYFFSDNPEKLFDFWFISWQYLKMKAFFYWAPRILGILLAVFISLFALDIFNENYSGWDLIISLVMHLLPVFAVVAFVVVAWRWENIGGWIFIVLGIAFVFIGGFELIAILLFTLPLLLVGSMFLLHHYIFCRSKKREYKSSQ